MPRSIARLLKLLKRTAEKAVMHSPRGRSALRGLLYTRRGILYRRICNRQQVDPRLIIFECYAGRSYSCSPRALYQEMLTDPAFANYTFVWVFNKKLKATLKKSSGATLQFGAEALDELSHAHIVRYASKEYYELHARAAYWISNYILPVHMHVREGQTYLQTWHGTPLKRLGCDIAADKRSAMYRIHDIHKRYLREGERFTHLLSPSPYASEKLASAFGLSLERTSTVVIEQGYPRNDFLHTFTDADVASVKERLGIPHDKKIVLYAPTFRDDQREPGLGYTIDTGIDFKTFAEHLGKTHVLLFKAHYLVASQIDFSEYPGTIINASPVSDINDLYIVSDLLVTDYSSVFFDYANLSKPVVFFPYDLQQYANELRGFYLDISDLPGPIVHTQDDLMETITALSVNPASTTEQFAQFRSEFLPLDDGYAARRVIDAMFGINAANTNITPSS